MTDTPKARRENPGADYYAACHGRWRGEYRIRITDPAALSRSGMSLFDRWSLTLLARWPRWLRPVVMDTSVDYTPGRDVVHTTTLSWMGIPLMSSIEYFTIDGPGTSLTVRGGMSGSAVVDSSGMRVDYNLTWRSVSLRQQTRLEGDRVTLEQTGPGFHGAIDLQRIVE